ncbi:MAG: CYTH domain-containing protein [Prevotella sp.]|nr:CYTH domain-containing protein [Prevotella sp.]
MKTEIESRLLDVDVEAFINLLKNNGAKFVGDWLQIRDCYDFHPKKANSWIRLRTNGIETTLTIKEINNAKIDGTKECEIVVSDYATTNEMLNKLGYHSRSRQENRRIRYCLDDVEIDIDFWPKIPAYVEFEAKNKRDIVNVCRKLNLEFNQLTSMDVEKIYHHYGYDLKKFPPNIALENEIKNLQFKLT